MFWKKDPLNQKESISQETNALEIWEKLVKDRLIDVQSDIENINMVLNEHKRRMDAFHIAFNGLIERNTDAIELQKTIETFLQKIGYAKVKDYDN